MKKKKKELLPEEMAFDASGVDFTGIFPGDSLIAKLRESRERMLAFDFWDLLPDQAKNGDPDTAQLDLQSVNAVLQVYDSLKPANKEKLLALADGNPFVMAGFCWELLAKKGA